jgi:curved DNA-binding protein CbpA
MATQDELKRSYRKLSKAYHPDAHAGNPAFEEHFKELNEAYQILGDRAKRQIYDAHWELFHTQQVYHSQTHSQSPQHYSDHATQRATPQKARGSYYGLSYWLICLLIGIVFKIAFFSDKPSLSQAEVLQRLQAFQAQNTPLYSADSILQASYKVQSDSTMRRVRHILDSLPKFELKKYSTTQAYTNTKDTVLSNQALQTYPQLLPKPNVPLRQAFADSLAWRQELRIWQIAYLLWKQDSIRWYNAQKEASKK